MTLESSDPDEVWMVFCTAPLDAAAALARHLVEERLAACVQRIEGVRSVYRWEGRVHDDPECLLVAKTTAARFAALAERLRGLHPYAVPEILAVPVRAGLPAYLQWVAAETRGEG
ncbi:MAG: divalent-cation tolerance protein CutA [Planctomycetes bacterium]|nr:divalent-cation tolerance protein CutA [Planctomycetota bacterium]